MTELTILKQAYCSQHVIQVDDLRYSVTLDGETFYATRQLLLEDEFDAYTRAFFHERGGNETLFVDVYTVVEEGGYLITLICQLQHGVVDVFGNQSGPIHRSLVEKILSFVQEVAAYRLLFATQQVDVRYHN